MNQFLINVKNHGNFKTYNCFHGFIGLDLQHGKR